MLHSSLHQTCLAILPSLEYYLRLFSSEADLINLRHQPDEGKLAENIW